MINSIWESINLSELRVSPISGDRRRDDRRRGDRRQRCVQQRGQCRYRDELANDERVPCELREPHSVQGAHDVPRRDVEAQRSREEEPSGSLVAPLGNHGEAEAYEVAAWGTRGEERSQGPHQGASTRDSLAEVGSLGSHRVVDRGIAYWKILFLLNYYNILLLYQI